jgi:hypothetical protein
MTGILILFGQGLRHPFVAGSMNQPRQSSCAGGVFFLGKIVSAFLHRRKRNPKTEKRMRFSAKRKVYRKLRVWDNLSPHPELFLQLLQLGQMCPVLVL